MSTRTHRREALACSRLQQGTEDRRGFHLSRVVRELAVAAVLEVVRLGCSPHDWWAGELGDQGSTGLLLA